MNGASPGPSDAALAPASDETIRHVAREVLARPEFDLGGDTRKAETLLEGLFRLLWWLLTPIRWLFDVLENIHPALAWVVIALLGAVLLLLVWHLAYTFRTALARLPGAGRFRPTRRVDDLDPADLEARADNAYSERSFIEAIRLLFRAAMLRLEGVEQRRFRVGVTNREILAHYRDRPPQGPLRAFVELIDRKWYGEGTCDESDFLECRAAYRQIRTWADAGGRGIEGGVGHAERA